MTAAVAVHVASTTCSNDSSLSNQATGCAISDDSMSLQSPQLGVSTTTSFVVLLCRIGADC
jgi:hypothetical protein